MSPAASEGLQRLVLRLGQQLGWARREGLWKLIEEKELHPVPRARAGIARARWRAEYGVAEGEATPVWVLGVQRSGTNLVTRALKDSLEIAVYSENHRRAFDQFRLREDERIRALIGASRHRFVLFKPLCDIHRALDFWGTTFSPVPSRMVWVYRSVDGRVASATARFGEANLELMRTIATGDEGPRWQTEGLRTQEIDLIRSFDWDRQSAESAAALFWYLRNDLLLRTGLHTRPRVTVVSYDRFVAAPAVSVARLGRFIGVDRPLDASSEEVRRVQPRRLELHPEIRRRCDDLEAQLDELERQASADPRGELVPGTTTS